MRLENILIAALISLFPVANVCGQYIVTDPDGYTNVREKPNANAKILGTYTDKDIIFDVGYFPEDDSVPIIESMNWLAVHFKSSDAEVGYIYRSNVEKIYNLPELKYRASDSFNLHFFDAETEISIQLLNIEKSKHIKKTIDAESGTEQYRLKDGKPHYPYWIFKESYAIANISIKYQREKTDVDVSSFYDIFLSDNPLTRLFPDAIYNTEETNIYFRVLKGKNGIYYLALPVGDGGETNLILWTIDKGKVIGREVIS